MARSAKVWNSFLCSSFQFRVVCCFMKLFSLNFFCILVSRDEFPGAELKVSSKQNLSNRKYVELVSFIALVWLCHGTRFFLVL